MRSRNPLFRRFSRLSTLQVVDMALSELEQNINLPRSDASALILRVGAAMEKKTDQTKTASDECQHIIRRALSLGNSEGYPTVADMIVDLRRIRPLVENEQNRLLSAARRAKEERRAQHAASPPLSDRLRRPLLLTFCTLFVIGLLFAGGVAIHYLYPNGVFLTPVTVPALVGQDLSSSVPDRELFTLHVTYQFDPNSRTGTILSQSPSAGMVRQVSPGRHPCTLNLTVSLGPGQVQVGDYAGMTKYQAMTECRRLGLIPVLETLTDHPAGNVAKSMPAAGEVVTRGSTITLYVGSSHHVSRVVVPNLVDNSEVGAATMLSSLGLSRGSISYMVSDRPAGTVIAQSILSGTAVPTGTKVSLVVSKGP